MEICHIGTSLEGPSHGQFWTPTFLISGIIYNPLEKLGIHGSKPIIIQLGQKKKVSWLWENFENEDKCGRSASKLAFCKHYTKYQLRKESSVDAKLGGDFVEEKETCLVVKVSLLLMINKVNTHTLIIQKSGSTLTRWAALHHQWSARQWVRHKQEKGTSLIPRKTRPWAPHKPSLVPSSTLQDT